jgi:hypothetical protein
MVKPPCRGKGGVNVEGNEIGHEYYYRFRV